MTALKEIEKIIQFHNSPTGKLKQQTYEANEQLGALNQNNGIAFERKQWNLEKRNSLLSLNSMGSLGPIDVVAIRKNYVLLISCKENGYIDPKERKQLSKLKARLPSFCRIQIRYKKNRKLKKMWF